MRYGNIDERIVVGGICNSYKKKDYPAFESSAAFLKKSCGSCCHFKNKKCDINVYNNILTNFRELI